MHSMKVMSPRTRLLLRKVRKQLDHQNTTIAASKVKIHNLQRQVNSFRPKKKQKVEENPNSQFIKIEEIMNTKKKIKQKAQRAKASKEVEIVKIEDICHVFQLK